jgi:hypothetical protein
MHGKSRFSQCIDSYGPMVWLRRVPKPCRTATQYFARDGRQIFLGCCRGQPGRLLIEWSGCAAQPQRNLSTSDRRQINRNSRLVLLCFVSPSVTSNIKLCCRYTYQTTPSPSPSPSPRPNHELQSSKQPCSHTRPHRSRTRRFVEHDSQWL